MSNDQCDIWHLIEQHEHDNLLLEAQVKQLKADQEFLERDIGLLEATLQRSASHLKCETYMVDHQVENLLRAATALRRYLTSNPVREHIPDEIWEPFARATGLTDE